ncbi:MAG TPA: DUF1559 domain-containing protein [Pirellulales bacterium]|nr:DUF1559 domain-containing protein [Pirellulales bacterium]
MRDHLLGYLLGALEPAEHELVESRLWQSRVDQSSPGEACVEDAGSLEHDLACLREKLDLLDDGGPYEPPAGLAGRTCTLVAARAATTASHAPCGALTSRGPTEHFAGANTGWRLPDMLVGSGIFIAACMLLFPAIANSRFNARRAACQNNLRAIGVALDNYSDFHGGYFPLVPEHGRLAAAGIYAPLLRDLGLLDDPAVLICPASPLAEECEQFVVPTVEELRQAPQSRLAGLWRMMGGSYGYTFGYVADGGYHAHRNAGRPFFALMADAPEESMAHSQAALPVGSGGASHDACGQNVLFEDGHVAFLNQCRVGGNDDHIFMNRHGYVGPGIGPDDAVIGRSSAQPVLFQLAR